MTRFARISALAVLFTAAALCFAQTSPTGLTFATSAGPAGVCLSGQCSIGSLSVESLTVTPNFSVQSTQIISPAVNLSYYGGGIEYALPLDSWLKNKTLIPTNTVRIAVHASPGVLNNGSTAAVGSPHFGAFAGGEIDYAPLSDGKFVVAGRVDALYAPGFGNGAYGQVYTGTLGYLFGGTKAATVSAQARRVWGTKK